MKTAGDTLGNVRSTAICEDTEHSSTARVLNSVQPEENKTLWLLIVIKKKWDFNLLNKQHRHKSLILRLIMVEF